MIFRERPCQRCNKETRQEICARENGNNGLFYGWYCLICKWWTKKDEARTKFDTWIPKEKLVEFGADLSLIRVVEITTAERCIRCHKRGTEVHHWAPKAIFGPADAETWPKDYLCKERMRVLKGTISG